MKYMDVLKRSSFFFGIPENDIEKIINCLHAKYREYEKNETILWEGSTVQAVGIVLSGHARSTKTDASGKLVIVTRLEAGSYIGVLLSANRDRRAPVSIQAINRMSVLFFPIEHIFNLCHNACSRHTQLLGNFFDGISEKALLLHDRNDCLIKPTVREKILTYLTRVANEKASYNFIIPFDRSAMAEYLNVERSSLSRELSRMKKDGLIDFYKNSFKLFEKTPDLIIEKHDIY